VGKTTLLLELAREFGEAGVYMALCRLQPRARAQRLSADNPQTVRLGSYTEHAVVRCHHHLSFVIFAP